MYFSNIFFQTDDCVDELMIDGGLNQKNFPVLTHEYNGAILFVPGFRDNIKIKLMTCPRAFAGETRHYGFRAIVSEYSGEFCTKCTLPFKTI